MPLSLPATVASSPGAAGPETESALAPAKIAPAPFAPSPRKGPDKDDDARWTTAYIGLGANLGDPAANLAAARECLAGMSGVRPTRVSSVYRTEPQGVREQPFFLNQVAELQCACEITPEALLGMLLQAEEIIGRRRVGAIRFGPRAIDMDLLLFGAVRMRSQRLVLPHPRMLERAFVLLPLAEIAPDLVLPQGIALREALGRVRYTLADGVIYQNATG